jgi:hypothetical protein
MEIVRVVEGVIPASALLKNAFGPQSDPLELNAVVMQRINLAFGDARLQVFLHCAVAARDLHVLLSLRDHRQTFQENLDTV